MEVDILEYQQLGTEHARTGNRYGPAAPRGSYQCSDSLWVALSGTTQVMAAHVLRAIGGEALVTDARFATNALRRENVEALDALIAEWCSQRARPDALAELTAAGCAVGPLESVASMLDNPQVQHRQSIVGVADDNLGDLAMTAVYPHFQEAITSIGRPGPAAVGHDTHSVLARDLGLDATELERLSALGVIQGPLPV